MIKIEENDATYNKHPENPAMFGSEKDYHIIEYNKSPYIIYEKFFQPSICKQILSLSKNSKWQDTKQCKIQQLDNDKAGNKTKWLKNIMQDLINDANESNFMLDIMSVKYLTLYKLEQNDYIPLHRDCDFWHNNTAYDKKISCMVLLNDAYEGGEYLHFMSNIPLPKDYCTQGTVIVFPTYNFYGIDKVVKGTKEFLLATCIGPKFK